MTDERDKKRFVLIPGSGPQQALKDGDDFYEKNSDVPGGILNQDSKKIPITFENMSAYLNSIISSENKYQPSSEYATTTLRDSSNQPITPVTPSSANLFSEDFFYQVVGETFTEDELKLLRNPDTGLHEALLQFIPHARGEGTKREGQTQYNSIRDPIVPDLPANAPEIQKKVSNILKRNRFNPSPTTPFLPLGSSSETIDQRPIGSTQTNLGFYDNNSNQPITYESMKKIGLALMLRGTGEFVKDGDPNDLGVALSTLLPGVSQLAILRRDRNEMWASSLTTDQGVPDGLGRDRARSAIDIINRGGEGSFGQLNNHLEPFGGFAPLGMIALAVALIVILKVIVETLVTILNLQGDISRPSKPKNDPANSPLKPMGRSVSRGRASEALAEIFGVHLIKHDYIIAVSRGIDVFFEFDGLEFLKVARSPGYYAVLVREIIRSGERIVRSLVDVFSLGNPVSGAQAIIGLIDIIKTSKIIGFLNVIASLGDGILTLEDQGFISRGAVGFGAEPGNLPDKGKISSIDRTVNNAATRIMKSRRQKNSTLLAWRTSSVPSKLSIPAKIQTAGFFSNALNFTEAAGGITQVVNKITSADIKRLEDELDSEYVPFYFRDLRTNEIIAFHAFIASLTDDYKANYEVDKHYGRVDPIMTYSDTARNISLSFHVVAADSKDFDTMWVKINKLVTMVYPQWSRGRTLTVENTTFIQPFSQIPTSSPVIRLRIGDVLHSNYSRFNLARLFGYAEPEFQVNGKKLVTDPKVNENTSRQLALYESIKKRMLEKPETVDEKKGYYPEESAILLANSDELTHISEIESLQVSDERPIPIKKIARPEKVKISERVQADNGSVQYKVEILNPPTNRTGKFYQVIHDMLRVDDGEVQLQATRQVAEENEKERISDIEEINSFISPKSNSIVRTFEDASGRGLAGVITSLQFDWHKPTWETEINRRAPQWCLVTMAFQPIHDIAPGIDADGYNRAPIYPVGAIRSATGDVLNSKKNIETYLQNKRAADDSYQGR